MLCLFLYYSHSGVAKTGLNLDIVGFFLSLSSLNLLWSWMFYFCSRGIKMFCFSGSMEIVVTSLEGTDDFDGYILGCVCLFMRGVYFVVCVAPSSLCGG